LDLDERSQQVKLMGIIYLNSKKLLVWLGVESNNSDTAMDFIATAARKEELGAEVYRRWIDQQATLPIFKGLSKAMVSFLDRPWFTRAWIVQ
jgi:hypothetical protein